MLLCLAKPIRGYALPFSASHFLVSSFSLGLSLSISLSKKRSSDHLFEESSTHSSTATYQQHHTDRKDQVVMLAVGVKQTRQFTMKYRETKHMQLKSLSRLTLTKIYSQTTSKV